MNINIGSQQFLKKFSPVSTNLPVGPCSNQPREARIRHLIIKQAMGDGTYMDFGTATSLLYKVSAVKYRID